MFCIFDLVFFVRAESDFWHSLLNAVSESKKKLPTAKTMDSFWCFRRGEVFYFSKSTLRFTKSAKALPFSMLLASRAKSMSCFTRLCAAAKSA